MAVSLGEAFITVRADGRGLSADLRREVNPGLQQMGDAAEDAGGRAERSMGRVRAALGAVAAAGAALGAWTFVSDTIKLGNEYTGALNTMAAVSSATAEQMEAVRAAAKALGSDITLPGTSAKDAALAMTELAKGGLSVEQSMAAAKGTLQLAAAAQIQAAEAATIQSSALNAFSLNADQAGRVSDVLANAANASAVEITDVALAMQAGASVAAGSKVPIEDFAAAVGLLGNNGIRGSDAGTLLKSALLALQSPSNEASKAMRALGLTAYDAEGDFVGLQSIFRQLEEAAAGMTDEQYAAATSTLFGADAARLAAIAAKEGEDGFEAMAQAMGREGAAADVAAAKMQGLGGAWEGLKSQFETFQIDLYERASPNLERLVRYATDKLPAVGDALVGGLERGIAWADRMQERARVAFRAAADYLQPLTSELDDLWDSVTADGGGFDTFFTILRAGAPVVLGTVQALQPVVQLAGAAVGFFSDLPGPVQAVVLAFAALKVASNFDLLGRMQAGGGVAGTVTGWGSSVTGFAQTWRANMSLAGDDVGALRTVTGGFTGALGVQFPNATRQVGLFRDSLRSAYDQGRELARYNVAQTYGTEALSKATGDFAGLGAAAKAAATGGVGALRSAAGGLVSFLGGPFGVAMAAGGLVIAGFAPSMEEAKQKSQELYDALDPLARAQQDVTRATNDLNYEIEEYGAYSPQAQEAARKLRDAQERLTGVQERTARATRTVTEALAAQVAQQLAGTNADLAASQAQTGLEQQIAATAEAVATYGGQSLEGRAATDQLTQAALTAAQAAAAQAEAHSTAATEQDKQAESDAALLASLQATAAQLGVNTPASIQSLIASLSASMGTANSTASAMTNLGLQVASVPNSKSVIINAPTAEQAQRLRDLGYQVQTLPNGQVRVSADTSSAMSSLQGLYSFMNQHREAVITSRVVGGGTSGSGGTQKRLAAGGLLEFYANGGLRPMRADVATIVPPDTWRVVGDRAVGDEAFIPINRDPRSVAIWQEAGRRMGLLPTSLMAAAGALVRPSGRSSTPTPAAVAGGAGLHVTYSPVLNLPRQATAEQVNALVQDDLVRSMRLGLLSGALGTLEAAS